MSKTKLSPFERLELAEFCPRCSAAPGDWCVTASGRWTGYLHALRFYAAKAAANPAPEETA